MTSTALKMDAGPGKFPWASFVASIKPPFTMRYGLLQMAAAMVLLMLFPYFGADLNGSFATILACCAILVIGMPHGAFDYHLIIGQAKGSLLRGALLVAAYLALAAMVYRIWQAYPAAALLLFLAISVVHFSEDWPASQAGVDDGRGQQDLLSIASAAAIICLPAILHPQELATAFAQLTGDAASTIAADIMLLLAPVAVLLALVKAATYWNDADYEGGMTLLLSLLVMAIFPPIIGFALYFCLVHSPKQFATSKYELQHKERRIAHEAAQGVSSALWMIWPISALAILIAAGIFYTEIRVDVASTAIASVFMTLSMLTVPHMAMPMLVEAAIAKRRP